MSEPGNFLTRWSRRKAEQRRDTDQQHETEHEDASREAAAPTTQERAAKPPEGEIPAGAPAFDPASLPPIDSITAATDVRGFLQPGVPADLRNAALRRAWSVDPGIRDFRGLQENDWNFNDPNGVPGFGPLDPGLDIKKMAAALFGDEHKKSEVADTTATGEVQPAVKGEAEATKEISADASLSRNQIVQGEENIAPQNNRAEAGKRPRKGGGALPQT